ncbi:MAG TPA: hypothetical protein VFB63_20930, partial [Bryobacteraceae bacterium]|nr:hypothetical protein [Bryobacteraceae bacterium]
MTTSAGDQPVRMPYAVAQLPNAAPCGSNKPAAVGANAQLPNPRLISPTARNASAAIVSVGFDAPP